MFQFEGGLSVLAARGCESTLAMKGARKSWYRGGGAGTEGDGMASQGPSRSTMRGEEALDAATVRSRSEEGKCSGLDRSTRSRSDQRECHNEKPHPSRIAWLITERKRERTRNLGVRLKFVLTLCEK